MATDEAKVDGRRARGEANDARIIGAAREVFIADPEAPIAAVAERAGVGISGLYRRYGSKEGLVRSLCEQGLALYLTELEAAMADEREAPIVLAEFLRRAVDADTHSLTLRLAGTFEPDEALWEMAARGKELNDHFYSRMKAAGALREDVTSEDFAVIFETLAAIAGPSPERTRELRHRYLGLVIDGLTASPARSLPNDPLSPEELAARWVRRS